MQKIPDALEKNMTQEEQVEAFIFELDNLIGRYASEFDLTLFSIVGALECVKLEIWNDNRDAQFVGNKK